MTKNLLDFFFKPESVAVVGASSLEGQVGRILLDNLKEGGFPGEIFPVTPEAPEVLGLTACAGLCRGGAAGGPGGYLHAGGDCAKPSSRSAVQSGSGRRLSCRRGTKPRRRMGRPSSRPFARNPSRPGCVSSGPDCMGLLCPASRVNASPAVFSGQALQPGLRFPERFHGGRHFRVGHPEQHRFFPFHQRGPHGGPGYGRSYRLPGKRDQRQKHPHLYGEHDQPPAVHERGQGRFPDQADHHLQEKPERSPSPGPGLHLRGYDQVGSNI